MTNVPNDEVKSRQKEIASGDFHAGSRSQPSPLQQANRALLLLQTFMESISKAADVSSALQSTLETICVTAGWAMGEIWRRSKDGSRLESDPLWYKAGGQADLFRQSRASRTFSPAVGLAGQVWVSKEPLWIANAGKDPELGLADLGNHAGPVTGLGIPVLADGQVILVLTFFAFDIRPARQDDLWLLTTMASMLGWWIHKFQAVQAMHESIERFEAVIQGSHDGVWDVTLNPGQTWDSPRQPIYYSPRYKQLLGFEDDELENVMDAWLSRIHPEDQERFRRAVQDHLNRRVPYEVEYRIQHKSGEYRWFSARGKAIWNDVGQPTRMAGSVRDITERRQAEESLRLRDRAVAASTCGIVIVDAQKPDYPIVYVNPSFERIFGYTAQEVMGRNPRFLQRYDRQQSSLPPLKSAIRQGQPHRAILRNYRKDGKLIWNELIVAPVHDEKKRLTHYVGIQNDISENIRSQEELRERERLYRSLTENIHSLIVIIDREGFLRYGSPSCERLVGYTPEEFLNKSLFEFIDPRDVPEVREALRQVIEKPGSVAMKEFRFQDKAGEWHALEGVGQNLLNDPAVSGIVINARDITERKQLERMVTQAEKMAAVGQLAAGIAHELNNPLHAILGFARSLLEEVTTSGPLSGPLKLIGQEASRCQKLVQNLLTFSRQKKNGMVPESAVELWEDILPLIETQAKVNGVAVEKQFEAELPLIKVDSSQIHQVLLNLCTNAFDAMPTGGRLTIGAAQKRRPLDGNLCVVLFVEDTGTGIEPKIKERIFEPFFTTKAVGAGTGLGLSLVYEIVQRHNGEIRVSSEIGKGSRFEVFLPPMSSFPLP